MSIWTDMLKYNKTYEMFGGDGELHTTSIPVNVTEHLTTLTKIAEFVPKLDGTISRVYLQTRLDEAGEIKTVDFEVRDYKGNIVSTYNGTPMQASLYSVSVKGLTKYSIYFCDSKNGIKIFPTAVGFQYSIEEKNKYLIGNAYKE